LSEEQQVEKIKIPTKTKIAVGWLILMGVVLIIWHIIFLLFSIGYSLDSGPTQGTIGFVLFLLIGSIFYFASAFFLSIRGMWICIVVVLFIIAIYSIGFYSYLCTISYLSTFNHLHLIPIPLFLGSLIYLTPPILLIIDRKNHFNLLRQLELEKNATE
jgi:hypothetical protein